MRPRLAAGALAAEIEKPGRLYGRLSSTSVKDGIRRDFSTDRGADVGQEKSFSVLKGIRKLRRY
ncbi:MAG: hypothetical protein ACK56I_31850, partial [bacterium]